MMGHRERMINGDEYDFLTRSRKWLSAKCGARLPRFADAAPGARANSWSPGTAHAGCSGSW
jgi:hypothetical protein